MSALTCSMPGCTHGVQSRGLCGMHYQALRKAGQLDPNYSRKVPPTRCSEPGCERMTLCRGVCQMHYLRKYHAAKDRPVRQPTHRILRPKNGVEKVSQKTIEEKTISLKQELDIAERAYRLACGLEARMRWSRQIAEIRMEEQRLCEA